MFGVIDRAGGTGEVENVIHLAAIEWLINVDLLKFKSRVATQVFKIGKPSSQKVVDGDNRISFGQQRVAKMRAQETGRPSNQCPQFAHEWLTFFTAAPS